MKLIQKQQITLMTKALNRNYHIDYEKHFPDGKIEIHIGID